MKIVSGIYVIRNKQNGKLYVGSSKNIRSRVNSHYSALRRGAHCNRHLQGAWNESDEQSFIDEILEECPESELLQREQYWITKLDVTNPSIGYNLSSDTTAPTRGLIFSAETRAKISKANKGKKRTPEFSLKMSAIHKGHVPTDTARKNMSVANKKRGTAHIEHMARLNSVRQKKDYVFINPDGVVYQVHGLVQFCEEHGLSKSAMCMVAQGKYKTYKGWKCHKVE